VNLERLRWGEWLAAFAALDLLLVTFRAWYKVTGGGAHVTGWDALEQGRYLLIATAVAGIFLWLLKASDDPPSLSVPLGWITAAVGFACTVYIAYRLATPPADNLDPDLGIYFGLLSALGVTVGGLLSARDEAADPAYASPGLGDEDSPATAGTATGVSDGALVADSGNTWSAAPATTGWSPAAPAAAAPAATAAVDRPLQGGDNVVLTAGGARFPAGTVAQVVEVFAGGALVEVKAADGMAERFEVPESAYERGPAGGAMAPPSDWSPAMPAPAGEDWGFDEPGSGPSDTLDSPAGETDAAAETDAAPAAAKVPWWKREIGGGKKKKDEAIEAGALGAAAAAGAAAVAADQNGSGDQKPGFFKRMFGGGAAKADQDTETLEGEPTPATDVAGLGQAAESDTAVDEGRADSALDEPASDQDSASAAAASSEPPAASAATDVVDSEPEVAPSAPEPEALASDSDVAAAAAGASAGTAAGAAASDDDAPAPEADTSVTEADASAPEPDAAEADASVADTDASAGSTAAATDSTEPAATAAEPDPAAADPEPEPAASEPTPAVSEPAPESDPEQDPEPAASAPEPEAAAPEPVAEADPEPVADAAPAAAEAVAADEAAKPKRKRSSGSRKVPKEALAAAADEAHPKVGDEVQLKVGGGRYDAGTRGRVVDVFSAGVIVELRDDDGRTERLDLPFEAIGPADA
jgi:nicotinate-nucleotide--dimethylbenzimidazole phosphoribosyltransferase